MPSLKLSNPFRRGADRPSLKQRAASLKATAARVMKRKPADPFEGTTCPDGFVPYPFDNPTSYASIGSVVIQAEAQRLLDLALDEYERVCGSFADHVSEERRESIRQANRMHLRLDALTALVGQPVAKEQVRNAPGNLVFEILAGWAEWARAEAEDPYPGEDDQRPSEIKRDRLLDAAEALPATQENLTAKALALAWLEYVDLWQRGKVRGRYGLDGRLAVDIHTAIIDGSVKG